MNRTPQGLRDTLGIGEVTSLQEAFEPDSASQPAQGRRHGHETVPDPRQVASIEELLQCFHILPVTRPLRFLAPNQIR